MRHVAMCRQKEGLVGEMRRVSKDDRTDRPSPGAAASPLF